MRKFEDKKRQYYYTTRTATRIWTKAENNYRSLAKKYNVTYTLIKQIIEGVTRNKSNYKLKNDL